MKINEDSLKDLTLILVLKNRLPFTERWIKFNLANKREYRILIADGSDTPIINDSILADIKSLGAEYIYFGPDHDLTFMTEKIYLALKHCKTKFVMLSSNDDFYLSRGMSESISFLRNNPDYISCSGRIQNFSVLPLAGTETPYGGSIFLGDELYPGIGLLDELPINRVKEFLSQDESFWHSVFRTENLVETYNASRNQQNDDFVQYDLFVNVYLSLSGKHFRLRKSYSMLHQVHDEMEARNLVSKNTRSFDWWTAVDNLMISALDAFGQSENFHLLKQELESYKRIGVNDQNASLNQFFRGFLQKIKYRFNGTKFMRVIDWLDPMTSLLLRDSEVRIIRKFLGGYQVCR